MSAEEVQLKRPRNAYLLFTIDHRQSVKEKNPEALAKDILKLLGAEWTAFTPEQKAPYEEKAKEEKDAYNAAIAAGATKPANKKRRTPASKKAKSVKKA